MDEHNDIFERMIVRSLDGELSADEQLDLDRKLIRDPAARQLMDEYRAVDSMARDSLQSFSAAEFSLNPFVEATPGRVRGWRVRGYWLIPGAIAAAILAIVMPKPSVDPAPNRLPSAGSAWSEFANGGYVRPASTAARPSVHRATGRDLVGVVGEDGNLYWIEVQRTRTVRLPNGNVEALSSHF